METNNEEARVDLTKIHNTVIPSILAWIIRIPKVILILCKFHKTKTHPQIFLEELKKFKNRYPRHSHIFTDGSKQEKTTGYAAIYNVEITDKTSPKRYLHFQRRTCGVDMLLDLKNKK